MPLSRALNLLLLLAAVAFGIFQWREKAALAVTAAKTVDGPNQPAPPELKHFIAHAIDVYRSGDFVEILKLMTPAEFQALQPRGKTLALEQLAQLQRERPEAAATAALNLREIQLIQDKPVDMEDDGTRAVYKLDTPLAGQTQVVFVKIGDMWYKP